MSGKATNRHKTKAFFRKMLVDFVCDRFVVASRYRVSPLVKELSLIVRRLSLGHMIQKTEFYCSYNEKGKINIRAFYI